MTRTFRRLAVVTASLFVVSLSLSANAFAAGDPDHVCVPGALVDRAHDPASLRVAVLDDRDQPGERDPIAIEHATDQPIARGGIHQRPL